MSIPVKPARFRAPVVLAVLTLLAAGVGPLTAGQAAAPEPSVLQVRAFLRLTRPAAVFAHDAHNEKAKLDDCAACHHGGEGLKQDRTDVTAGAPCFQCHPTERSDGGTRLQLAYHRQCLGCHDRVGQGPQACGACHVEPGKKG